MMSATDEVPTPVVVGVLGSLALLAVAVLGADSSATLPSQSATSAASNGCPAGSTRTPRYDEVKVRTEPSETAPLLLNRKATEMLGRIHYHQVDSTTAVSLISCTGDWVEIAVTEPAWLRHVRGWVPSDAVLRPSEIVAGGDVAPSFANFRTEVERTTKALSCTSPKITPAQFGDGALYGCIQGQSETAKYWINEDGAVPGQVENVKVMWNNWTSDRGWGVHADRSEAAKMVDAATRLYAPEIQSEVLASFFAQTPRKWTSGSFELEYRWTPGPAIDEHLLTILPR